MLKNIRNSQEEKWQLQIKEWLCQERMDTGKGFYCHWDMITDAFAKNQLIFISEKDVAIGFLVFSVSDIVMEIKLAEIKPSQRGLGFGRKMVEKTFSKLRDEGVVVAELFCSPKKSKPIWEKMGFLDFPKFRNTKKIRMYKPIVPVLEQSEINEGDEGIELWNVQPHPDAKVEPKWRWRLAFKANSRELIRPIIHPTDFEWQIGQINKNLTEKVDLVKHFAYNNTDAHDFIIINNLK